MFLNRTKTETGIRSLPHGRGDVSMSVKAIERGAMSSPRAWGCFSISKVISATILVFPTGVGMFPSRIEDYAEELRLPHGRGDVSSSVHCNPITVRSSPRAWGCFLVIRHKRLSTFVFPTGVGMFPSGAYTPDLYRSLPHGRGDVSFSGSRPRDLAASSPRAWGCFPATSR